MHSRNPFYSLSNMASSSSSFFTCPESTNQPARLPVLGSAFSIPLTAPHFANQPFEPFKLADPTRAAAALNTSFWQSREWEALKARSEALIASQNPSLPLQPPVAHRNPIRPKSPELPTRHIPPALVKALSGTPTSSLMPTRKCRKCTCPNCTSESLGLVEKNRGRKVHLCVLCGKTYGKTSHLTAHIRWHRNERPFQCTFQFCTKAFTRSDELQRHMRTHTGDKKFQCEFCEKRFMRSDHLSKHRKVHGAMADRPSVFGKMGQASSLSPSDQTTISTSPDSGYVADQMNSLYISDGRGCDDGEETA